MLEIGLNEVSANSILEQPFNLRFFNRLKDIYRLELNDIVSCKITVC